MRRLLPVVAVLAILSLAGSACGSSKKTEAKATGTTAAGAQTTSASSSNSSASSSTTAAPDFSGSSNSKYCQLAKDVEAKSRPEGTDLKATYAEFDKLADQFLAVVPSAIKTDAHTLVDGVKQIEGVLKDANWDITKVDQAKLQSFNDPKFEDASKRIDAYNEQVCGLKSGSSGSSTP